jgi:hypothetical protein
VTTTLLMTDGLESLERDRHRVGADRQAGKENNPSPFETAFETTPVATCLR